MRIVKGTCLIDIGPSPFPSASRRRAHKIFNKNTEKHRSQRKFTTFVEERRREISHKTEHKQILREIKNAVELKIFID